MNKSLEQRFLESTFVPLSWSVSVFIGIPVYFYCLYFVLARLRINSYQKSLLIVIACHTLFGYIATFVSLLPIFFENVQNSVTCTLLTIATAPSGSFLVIVSGKRSFFKQVFTICWFSYLCYQITLSSYFS